MLISALPHPKPVELCKNSWFSRYGTIQLHKTSGTSFLNMFPFAPRVRILHRTFEIIVLKPWYIGIIINGKCVNKEAPRQRRPSLSQSAQGSHTICRPQSAMQIASSPFPNCEMKQATAKSRIEGFPRLSSCTHTGKGNNIDTDTWRPSRTSHS